MDGDKGVVADKILGTYEEIIRRTYLAEGHCSEEDIIKFCGFMESKLQGELQVKYFTVAYFSRNLHMYLAQLMSIKVSWVMEFLTCGYKIDSIEEKKVPKSGLGQSLIK